MEANVQAYTESTFSIKASLFTVIKYTKRKFVYLRAVLPITFLYEDSFLTSKKIADSHGATDYIFVVHWEHT